MGSYYRQSSIGNKIVDHPAHLSKPECLTGMLSPTVERLTIDLQRLYSY